MVNFEHTLVQSNSSILFFGCGRVCRRVGLTLPSPKLRFPLCFDLRCQSNVLECLGALDDCRVELAQEHFVTSLADLLREVRWGNLAYLLQTRGTSFCYVALPASAGCSPLISVRIGSPKPNPKLHLLPDVLGPERN